LDADQNVVGVSKIARDISEQKRSQEIQALLMRELNHRSKNLLAVADAIVRQTARSTPPRELVERVSRRLNSLSINQDLLVAHDWRGVDISRIVHAQLHAIIDGYEDRVTIEGESCVVNPRVGQALSLAIYELAANALKFGSLSVDGGKVEIKWTVDQPEDERMFHMTWRESGGPRVTRPRKRGFGTTISEQMIARSVLGQANIDYANDGVVWQLTAPESALIQPEQAYP
jgi:two-component sensor histidine kinase